MRRLADILNFSCYVKAMSRQPSPQSEAETVAGRPEDAATLRDSQPPVAPRIPPAEEPAAGAGAAEDPLEKCCSCRQEKPRSTMKEYKADAATGAKQQLRCEDSNGLRARLYRMCKANAHLKMGFDELGPDAKTGLMAAANSLAGESLKKVLLTTIQHNRIQRHCELRQVTGDFVNIKDIKDEYISKEGQAAWDSYYDKTPKMTCPLSGKEQIWKPTWSMTISNESTETLEQKRRIEGDEKVAKRPRRQLQELAEEGVGEAPDGAEEAGGAPACKDRRKGRGKGKPPTGPVEKPHNVATTNRLTACKTQLEKMTLDLQSIVSEASAADMVDNIAPALLRKATNLVNSTTALAEKTKVSIDSGAAFPAALREIWEGFKQAKTNYKEVFNKIKDTIKDTIDEP